MTAADIARAAFEELLSVIGGRIETPKVVTELTAELRDAFEQVLIRLRFVEMEATCIELDLGKLRAEREREDAHQLGLKIGGFDGSDHIDVTVIDPDDIDE